MHDLSVLLTFAGGLAMALVFGLLAERFKLSPIVGYLLAGVAVGPFTPGFVADRQVAEHFAQIGVILLLFGVGLHFDLKELFAVWRIAVPGALIQSTMSTLALAGLLRLLGWDWIPGLILGMAISVASTVVMAMVLGQRGDLHASIGYIALGWTVVEDLLTVAVLLMLPILFSPAGGEQHSVTFALGVAALKAAGLVVSVVVLGRWFVPWVLERTAKTRTRELFTLAVLVLAIGIAVGSSGIFGMSIELGAFLAGLAVGRTEFAARAAGDAMPMRDAFAVLFFVAVGMLFNPASLIQKPLVIAAVLLVVVVVKPLAAILTVRLLGEPTPIAIPVGAAFSQVGEFSFILTTLARGLGLVDDAGWNALVAASIISIALNPTIYRRARAWSARRVIPAPPVTNRAKPPIEPNRCILIGYGPVGRIVHTLLMQRGANVTVLDLNLETVRQLRESGAQAIYADVLRPGALEAAGVESTATLILSADIPDAVEVIRHARLVNPELRILARCRNLREAQPLRHAGADTVAAGEAEVGVALAEAVMSVGGLPRAAPAEHRDALRKTLYEGDHGGVKNHAP